MGYYTNLQGMVELDIAPEAGKLIAADFKAACVERVGDWSELEIFENTLTWDEEFLKRYEFENELKAGLAFLRKLGINANGSIYWDGEESDDLGAYRIINSVLQVIPTVMVTAEWEGLRPPPLERTPEFEARVDEAVERLKRLKG